MSQGDLLQVRVRRFRYIFREEIQHLLVLMSNISRIYSNPNKSGDEAFRYRCHVVRIIRAIAIIVPFISHTSIPYNNNSIYIAVLGFDYRFKP
ncbi:hypothetical protein D3C85_1348630 [compost metagenome]